MGFSLTNLHREADRRAQWPCLVPRRVRRQPHLRWGRRGRRHLGCCLPQAGGQPGETQERGQMHGRTQEHTLHRLRRRCRRLLGHRKECEAFRGRGFPSRCDVHVGDGRWRFVCRVCEQPDQMPRPPPWELHKRSRRPRGVGHMLDCVRRVLVQRVSRLHHHPMGVARLASCVHVPQWDHFLQTAGRLPLRARGRQCSSQQAFRRREIHEGRPRRQFRRLPVGPRALPVSELDGHRQRGGHVGFERPVVRAARQWRRHAFDPLAPRGLHRFDQGWCRDGGQLFQEPTARVGKVVPQLRGGPLGWRHELGDGQRRADEWGR
mmetsp:Transcript_87894/g.253546  ORF Transcript_87894/g.253546 Transcript_87894/m.253546 type:complete len:320 (-) Transcript_87894:334-1293(-)